MSEGGFWDTVVEDAPETVQPGWVNEPEDEPEVPDLPSNNLLGFLNLGQLQEDFTVRGHTIVLRTLTMDEELEVGLLVKRYSETIDEGRALATALVAASIVSIDGKPLVLAPLGPNESIVKKRFDYVRTTMYWPVIRVIYEEGYLNLIQSQVDALDELRKK